MPPTGDLPAPTPHHEAFARRRRALSARFADDTLIIPAGHLKVRSNDTHYAFRPNSDFYYLTGNREPDCVLVLEPLGFLLTAALFMASLVFSLGVRSWAMLLAVPIVAA